MALLTQRFTTPLGRACTFGFPDPVVGCLVGLSRFSLTFGSTDHMIKEIHLSTQVAQDGKAVTVTVNASMQDTSGHQIDLAESTATITVLAWTNEMPVTLAVGGVTGLVNGSRGPSSGIATPGGSVISQAVLSGFHLDYGDKHDVLSVNAQASTSINGSLGYVNAAAGMQDASGHSAPNPTIDGTLLLASVQAPGLVVGTLQTQTRNPANVTLSVPSGYILADAAVMLSGFTVQYPGTGDHWIKTIGAGALGCSISGANVVTLSDARAFMSDNSGHRQDDANSNVSLVVIGILRKPEQE
ncbi:MAG: hypothetical protein RQ966_04530 [Acetobacteraceae bacterium]|nr:hypothetical protein [Acetobacteraceae bacterium]